MIRFKPSVRFNTYSKELKHILEVLFNLNEQQIPEYPKDWVITSVNDSTHSVNSKHYKDQAIDLRSHNFKNLITKLQFVDLLELKLGNNYTVLLEGINTPNEHYHIQLRRGL